MHAAPLHVLRTLALFVLATLALITAPVAAEITVKHTRGETVLPERPRTVLVFDLAVLDTLDALGVEVTGVPGSHVPDFLSKYRDARYVKIGSLFDPDFEAVNAAAPDLIIVAARSSPAYPALSKIAPTIDLTLPSTDFIAGVRGNVETLGRIFGKEAEAATLVARMEAAAARIRNEAPKAGTALMMMVNGGKLTVYGPGSRFGWLHDELGLTPAVPDTQAATHGEAVSFEFILKTDPDWLIVLDRDAAIGQAGTSARQVLDNDLIAATKAAKSGRIIYVDPARWYIVGGGGAAFTTIVQDMATALEAKPQP